MKSNDILDRFAVIDEKTSKHELSGIFHGADHQSYRTFMVQYLRDFLNALQTKIKSGSMKSIFVFLCLFAAISFAKAQDASNSNLVTSSNQNTTEDDDSPWLKNRIGVYGSFFSGYGLSYQHQFENGFSLRTQLFAYGSNDDNDDYNSDEFRFAYGADLQYNLIRSRNTRLYALAGSFLDYYESGNNNYTFPSKTKDYDIERYINVGVAFGIELMAWRNLSFVIEGGYYGRFGNNSITVYKPVNGQSVKHKEKQTPKSFGFGVGGGISYAF